MIEKRMFYIVSSCAIILACWFAKNCFDVKAKDALISAEKRVQLTEYYQNEFKFYWKTIIDKKNNDAMDISIAHEGLREVANNMRCDGYTGEEISHTQSAGYRMAHEPSKFLKASIARIYPLTKS